MPWITQMLGCAVTILGIAFALWLGFWVFLGLMVLGVLLSSAGYLRRVLTEKGIINPNLGVPPEDVVEEETATLTIIDGEFERMEDESSTKGE